MMVLYHTAFAMSLLAVKGKFSAYCTLIVWSFIPPVAAELPTYETSSKGALYLTPWIATDLTVSRISSPLFRFQVITVRPAGISSSGTGTMSQIEPWSPVMHQFPTCEPLQSFHQTLVLPSSPGIAPIPRKSGLTLFSHRYHVEPLAFQRLKRPMVLAVVMLWTLTGWYLPPTKSPVASNQNIHASDFSVPAISCMSSSVLVKAANLSTRVLRI